MRRNRWLAGIFADYVVASAAQVAEPPQKLPVVKSGDMPFYPTPLRVFLTGCEVDGSTVSCERLTIRLYSGSLVVTPTRFREAKREGFVVPQEFRTMKNFSVRVETVSGSFTVANENTGFLKGKWHVGIDHAPFKEETPIYDAPATLHCAGFIVYEWGEPGVTVSAPCK
jgi:hypothetical protein